MTRFVQANGAMAASQRQLPAGPTKRAHADCLVAAVGHDDRRWFVWRLYEVQQS